MDRPETTTPPPVDTAALAEDAADQTAACAGIQPLMGGAVVGAAAAAAERQNARKQAERATVVTPNLADQRHDVAAGRDLPPYERGIEVRDHVLDADDPQPTVSRVGTDNLGDGTERRDYRIVTGSDELQMRFSRPGRRGLTHEALLAVLIDRLRGFQGGATGRSRENAIVVTKLEEALHWLQARTRDRRRRGVVGIATP